MQQASSSIGKIAPTAGSMLPPAAASPRFVVNLCASTTPVGLVQPTHAGLKRFTFFVSRRLEEGRERFRLHMGYFDSQEEAEKILDLVRDVYPAAWAGVAPGIKLRARAALPDAAPPPSPLVPSPLVHAAADVSAAAPPAAPPVASPVTVASTVTVKLELVPDLPRVIPAPIAERDAAADAAARDGAARSLSDLRATIDSLGDRPPLSDGQSPETQLPVVAPVAVPAAAPERALEGAAVLRLLESARPALAARAVPIALAPEPRVPQMPVATPAESKRAAPAPQARPTVMQPVVERKAALPLAVPRAEPALFAVQLLWSVKPIDMGHVPQLAIFSAYTLYGAEGNRDGRRWYGLRLGFFTDAVSAKQVAQYVRSEFTSVSVVPVSVRERARASTATSKPMPSISPSKRNGPELNFIEDVPTDTATSGSRPALQLPDDPTDPKPEMTPAVRAAMAAVGVSSRATTGGKRAKLRVGQGMKPVSKRPSHNHPLSLEETLEILGAGALQVDNGRGELMNDSSLRERKGATPGASRFGRLINRLAERLGNS